MATTNKKTSSSSRKKVTGDTKVTAAAATPSSAPAAGGTGSGRKGPQGAAERSYDSLLDLASLRLCKVAQAEHKGGFEPGAVVLQPDGVILAKPGEPIRINPLFVFLQWVEWTDRRDRSGPPIRRSTFNPSDELARRARSRGRRFLPYEGGPKGNPFQSEAVEEVAVVSALYPRADDEAWPFLFRFSRGEHATARALADLVASRRFSTARPTDPPPPLFAHVIELATVERQEDKGAAWRLEVRELEDEGARYVDPADLEWNAERFRLYAERHGEKRLRFEATG